MGGGRGYDHGPGLTIEDAHGSIHARAAERKRRGIMTKDELNAESRPALEVARRAERRGEHFIGPPNSWADRAGPEALVPLLAATIPVAAGVAILPAVTIVAVASGTTMTVVAAAITIVAASVPVPRVCAVAFAASAVAIAIGIRAGVAGTAPAAVTAVGFAIAGRAHALGSTALSFDHLAGRVADERKLCITRGGDGKATGGIDTGALTGCDVHAGPRLWVRDVHLPPIDGDTSPGTPAANDELGPLHDRSHMGCHDCEMVHVSPLRLYGDLAVVLVDIRELLAVPVENLNHGVPGQVDRFGAPRELDPSIAQRLDVSIIRDDVATLKRHPLAVLKCKYRPTQPFGDPVVGQGRLRGSQAEACRSDEGEVLKDIHRNRRMHPPPFLLGERVPFTS